MMSNNVMFYCDYWSRVYAVAIIIAITIVNAIVIVIAPATKIPYCIWFAIVIATAVVTMI